MNIGTCNIQKCHNWLRVVPYVTKYDCTRRPRSFFSLWPFLDSSFLVVRNHLLWSMFFSLSYIEIKWWCTRKRLESTRIPSYVGILSPSKGLWSVKMMPVTVALLVSSWNTWRMDLFGTSALLNGNSTPTSCLWPTGWSMKCRLECIFSTQKTSFTGISSWRTF